jgi:hypothetical protein
LFLSFQWRSSPDACVVFHPLEKLSSLYLLTRLIFWCKQEFEPEVEAPAAPRPQPSVHFHAVSRAATAAAAPSAQARTAGTRTAVTQRPVDDSSSVISEEVIEEETHGGSDACTFI